MADPDRKQIQEEIRAAFGPIFKVLGVLLVLALAAGLAVIFYFMHLAGGLWGGS
ncbi:MAG: hypothetical protein HY700_03895 [Gemmatimonadetes bacterium]|nr:hypothetical protein [Gemmatimonadota bacterium]